MTESQTTTENISDGTAGQSSETFLDFLRRTISDGIDIDAVDDGECFQESAVRHLDRGNLDRLLGNELAAHLETLERLRAELAGMPADAASPERVRERRQLEEHCHDVERDIARGVLEVRLRLRPEDERSGSRSADEASAS